MHQAEWYGKKTNVHYTLVHRAIVTTACTSRYKTNQSGARMAAILAPDWLVLYRDVQKLWLLPKWEYNFEYLSQFLTFLHLFKAYN